MRTVSTTAAIFMILATSTSTAADPKWERVTATDTAIVLVDVTSIKKRGGRLTAWIMHDYLETQKLDDGFEYRSSIFLEVYDCASERSGSAVMVAYSGDSGTGQSNSSGSIEPSNVALGYKIPGTVGQTVLDFVCARASRATPSPQPKTPAKPTEPVKREKV